VDERTEALLGPERAPDPAEARALAERVEEEDFQLRLKLARQFAPLILFFGFLLYLLAPRLIGRPSLWSVLIWAAINLPLLTALWIVLRTDRLPLGRGRVLRGRRAMRLVLIWIAVNLYLFFGRGWFQALWDSAAPAGW
jgi:hypothetical protein